MNATIIINNPMLNLPMEEGSLFFFERMAVSLKKTKLKTVTNNGFKHMKNSGLKPMSVNGITLFT